MTTLSEKAARFRALHQSGCFILPNAWDVPSALMAMDAGYEAVATTSVGVAFAAGLLDGQNIGRERMLAAVRAIAGRLPVPVSADLEAGYGAGPADVAQTIRLAIAAGAVGCNLEDSNPATRKLIDPQAGAERIRAAVGAAAQAGLPDFVVNARTDAFFSGELQGEAALAEAIARGRLYLQAGAASVFTPGPGDTATARALTTAIPGPVNIMAGGGPPTAPLAELADAGVRRISLGGSVMAAAYGHVRELLADLRQSGDFAYTRAGGRSFMTLAGLIRSHPEETADA